MSSRKALLLVGLLILVPLSLRAQVSATLVGTVTDSSGAVIPAAAVTATEQNTGVVQRTTTTAEGVYTIPFITPGTYRIEVETPGFKKFSRANVLLAVSTTVRIDAQLSPGNVTETVQVTAASPVLTTDKAEVARNFEKQESVNLPLPSRSPEVLAQLLPGVYPGSTDSISLEDPMDTTFYNVNGQNTYANRTLVDGIENTTVGVGDTVYVPIPDVVAEVHVATSNYQAEFGQAGGAVVNIATRGGTNKLHGQLWEYNRITNLVARDFFNPAPLPKPVTRRNEFGAAVGGPIKKDKTFFYGAYQGKYLASSVATITTVPVDAWRTGDFSGVPGLNIFNPATGNADGSGRTQFTNNNIASSISPVTQKLTNLFPQPNIAGFNNNLDVNVPNTYTGNIFDGRVDQNFSDSTKMFVKFNYARYEVQNFSAYGPVIGSDVACATRTDTAIVNLTHSFSPTLVMEARGGYDRYHVDNEGININHLLPGVTSLNQYLGISDPTPNTMSEQGMAVISWSAGPFASLGAPSTTPDIRNDHMFNASTAWSKVYRNHTFKWGFEFDRTRSDKIQAQGVSGSVAPRGQFDFHEDGTLDKGGPAAGSYGTTGNTFAAFMLGWPDQISRSYMAIEVTNRLFNAFSYVQDTWQVTPKLTVDIGIRHELQSTEKARYPGGQSAYDPASNSLYVCGIGIVPMSCGIGVRPDDFAPRLGIAYRLNSKTVIRTGYGISFWQSRGGMTTGSLPTQYPAVFNVQEGNTGLYTSPGSVTAIPAIVPVPIPTNGVYNPAPNQSFFYLPFVNKMPTVDSYSFTVQRELTPSMAIDVAYVGNVGRHEPTNGDYLSASPPGTGAAGDPETIQFGRTATTNLRAYLLNSNYNSLQANLIKHYSKGLSFTLAYSYSKSMDIESNGGATIDNINFQRNYGPSDFDRTHMITASHLYELPFGKGRQWVNNGPLAYVVGDWQLNGVLRAMTGTPFTALASTSTCDCPGGNSNFADAVHTVSKLGGEGPLQPWFDTTAFAVPGNNRFGDVSRNTIRGPGLINYDLSIFRTFPIKERAKIEFRGEFFNLTNSPHFANPSGNGATVGTSTFGIITATNTGFPLRQVQFALRVTF